MTQKIGQTQGKPEDFRMNFQSAKRKKKYIKILITSKTTFKNVG